MENREMIRKRGSNSLIIAIIVVASIMTFIGGYSLSESFRPPYRKLVVDQESEPDINRSGMILSTLGFDEENIVNGDRNADYSLKMSTYGIGENTEYYFYTVHGLIKNEVEFVKAYYGDKKDESMGKVKFASDVVDTYLFDENKLLFLLDDGTVEYINISSIEEGKSISYSEVPTLKNTAKFYSADVCKTETTEEGRAYKCRLGNFAQLMNGNIYDLSLIEY